MLWRRSLQMSLGSWRYCIPGRVQAFRLPDASDILSLIEYDTNNGAAQSSDFLTFERQEMNSQYMGPEYSVDC